MSKASVDMCSYPLRITRQTWLLSPLTMLAFAAMMLILRAPVEAQDVSTAVNGALPGQLQSPITIPAVGRLSATVADSSDRPKLYDNTRICTADVLSLPVGGAAFGASLSVRDWFTTSGGHVVGFDLYVVNGGPGAVPNAIDPIRFYDGTDAHNMGISVPPYAYFRSPGAPRLSPIPVHRDPATGEPRLMIACPTPTPEVPSPTSW